MPENALVKFDPDFVPVPQHKDIIRTEPVYLPPLPIAGTSTVYLASGRPTRNVTPILVDKNKSF